MKKKLFLGSTEVEASKSAGEITSELVRAGARLISTKYGGLGDVIGIEWTLEVQGTPVQFAMPARTESVLAILKRQSPSTDKATLEARAKRIAWRQLLVWVKAQNAMIETGMVMAAEVFMPYALSPATNQTMYHAWTSQLLLTAPEGAN